MYALNNEVMPHRRAQVRSGRLPRLLAESLILAWGVVTAFFDDESAARRRLRGRSRRRLLERGG
ncbi:MAG: hypothetical protein LBC90_04760 [Candidatus Adiutrix sp.]|nr:hypothetical protein [Candidatus Adiutrix sp.]